MDQVLRHVTDRTWWMRVIQAWQDSFRCIAWPSLQRPGTCHSCFTSRLQKGCHDTHWQTRYPLHHSFDTSCWVEVSLMASDTLRKHCLILLLAIWLSKKIDKSLNSFHIIHPKKHKEKSYPRFFSQDCFFVFFFVFLEFLDNWAGAAKTSR